MGLALETSSWAARGHTQLGVGSANSGELETRRGVPSSHDWRLESHEEEHQGSQKLTWDQEIRAAQKDRVRSALIFVYPGNETKAY